MLLNILIAISTNYCKELSPITQICSNSTCGEKKNIISSTLFIYCYK